MDEEDPGYGMDEEDDGNPYSPDLSSLELPAIINFECGDHMETYVSIRNTDSAANSVRCVWFFKNSGRPLPRHDGFLWYAEGVEPNDRDYREFGRYTAGRARTDFLQEFPNGPGLMPNLNAGNFNVRYIGVDAAGIPSEIRFGTPITDVWKRVIGNDSVLFERRLRSPVDCGPNMLLFRVYALRDKDLRSPTGLRCMSIDFMSWYGLGRVGDKGYLHIATTSDSSSKWISVGDAGLPVVAVDICDRTDFCNVANVRLRRMCINVDKYKGPILTVPEWSEVWVPDTKSRATSTQIFPDSHCPFTDNADWDY